MFREVARISGLTFWLAICTAVSTSAADNPATEVPDFRQVFDLIRQNLPDATAAELNRAAVEGLVAKLAPRVTLVKSNATNESVSSGLTRSNLFDGRVLYFRIGTVNLGMEKSLLAAWLQFSASNNLAGVVLDLRYANGEDYSAAASVARLFLQTKQPLLDCGDGMVESNEGGAMGTCPVATLVNRETSGAAEVLAAVLRGAGRGLVLGSRTAGKAGVSKEFPLANGDRLRIITRAIRLGDGSQMAATGMVPDIDVEVSPSDEKVYYEDPFAAPQGADGGMAGLRTNQPTRRPRYGEAELVRDRRQGPPSGDVSVARQRPEPEVPQIQDAALLRALDLLKGLAIVRQTRS